MGPPFYKNHYEFIGLMYAQNARFCAEIARAHKNYHKETFVKGDSITSGL